VSQQPARPDYSGPGKSDINGTSLEGKIALIPGAARAIGRATALRLSRQGATLAVHYRTNAELAESLASAIRAENRKVLLVQGDVTEESQVKSIVAQVNDKLGPVDILVNNAASFYPGELADFKETEMDSMWRTNVIGPVHLIRLVVEGMMERRSGRIYHGAGSRRRWRADGLHHARRSTGSSLPTGNRKRVTQREAVILSAAKNLLLS